MVALIKRRIQIVAFEHQRIIRKAAEMRCPICQMSSQFLTPRQAGALAQVTPKSIYRWLASGKVHSLKTAGGGVRICSHSLFRPLPGDYSPPAAPQEPQLLLEGSR
jgi:hypothetical protein